MNKRIILLFWVGLLLVACQARLRSTARELPVLLLDYTDFGPQYLAALLLGDPYPSWASDEQDAGTYRIGVVVYKDDVDPDLVRMRYRIDATRGQDYRYIAYTDAMAYLERHSRNAALSESSRQKLEETKWRIIEALGTD